VIGRRWGPCMTIHLSCCLSLCIFRTPSNFLFTPTTVGLVSAFARPVRVLDRRATLLAYSTSMQNQLDSSMLF
jgi:hypothetical protein